MDDPDLTPEFPGITDSQSLRDWDPPPPFDRRDIQRKIDRRDEDYWNTYRTAPKAYVTLKAGQAMWGSRLGNVTSIRLAPKNGTDLARAAAAFAENFHPDEGVPVFDAVKERSKAASAGGANFSMLFLGFSLFLIVAALLLVGLLYRLNLERRASEIGLLLALGYRQRTVRRLLLIEGGMLAVLGGLLGVLAAAWYAGLLLKLLAAWWPGGIEGPILHVHRAWQSQAIGFGSAVLTSGLTIAWAVYSLGRVPARSLLGGATAEDSVPVAERPPPRWSVRLSIGASALALVLAIVGGFVHDHEAKASSFFGGGALLLTGTLAAVWAWFRGRRHRPVNGHGLSALTSLAMRNAARQPVRSLLTAGLLAAAAFVVLAVQSFHRDLGKDALAPHSGTGGFPLLAESDVVIFQDLNTAKGRQELRFPKDSEEKLSGVKFYPLRLKSGDDASCLNLYQPRQPRLLGMPRELIELNRFAFAGSEAKTDAERTNPWLLLDKPGSDDALPVIADANTVEWMLGKKLGDVVQVQDAKGKPADLRIVGLLDTSIFQSELILSEANLLKLYPDQAGYGMFLIDAPADRAPEVKGFLEKALAARGFEVTSTTDRLRTYLEVENTYLATFQALGGLGLILGALGLVVVLLRGIWERRGELALFRALGYRQSALGWLVLAENGFLLVLGLGCGGLAAILAVAPHLLSGGGSIPWLRLFGLLALVLLVGLGAGAVAVLTTLRAPLVPALRRE